jgi:hypothetical protein
VKTILKGEPAEIHLNSDDCFVTDLINALPGNSSVNTVQHATTQEAVFSVSAVTSQQWIGIT